MGARTMPEGKSIKEQLKDVGKELKNKEKNFLVLSFGYSSKYVLPVTKGAAILELFEEAELYSTEDYNNPKIRPISMDGKLESFMISGRHYTAYKASNLLGIPSGDILQDGEK
jgi:hypothetical protein